MNERIRELAFEANKDLDGNVPIGFAEKFAELIVRECLGIVANADMSGSWITHPKDVLYVACDQIKEHFGVEE